MPLRVVLPVISVGGVRGALARYGIQLGLPHRPAGFPWATFLVNITGCLLIGALMVLIVEVWSGPRRLRPFLGVGVPDTTPSWGAMLSQSASAFQYAVWLMIFPGIALSLTVLGFNLLGDGLRRTLDPKLRQQEAG